MKFSEQWLRSWVSPRASRDELVARLSMACLLYTSDAADE